MDEQPDAAYEKGTRIGQYIWLIRIRWFALIAALLLASLFSYLGIVTQLNPIIIFLVLGAFLNLLYYIALKHRTYWERIGEKEICLCQILTDIMGILALTHFTGGLTNPFVFFIAAPVIVAGIFFQPWWTYVLAFLAWGLTGLLGLLEANGVLTQHKLFHFMDQAAPESLHAYRSSLLVALGCFLFASAYLVCKIVGVLRKREWHLAHLKTSMQAFRRSQATVADLQRVALGGLAKGIGREVKDPMGIVRARVHSMQYDLEDLGQRDGALYEDLQVVVGKVNQMEKTIDKLIAFFSHNVQERKSLDLAGLLDRSIGKIREQLDSGRVKVASRIRPALPGLFGSEDELGLLFSSLLQNAADALEELPHGAITLSARKLGGASGLLVVRIRDNGPGIPPGIQERIFDPFFSTRGDDRGMGLGIAYTIVRNHGGELRIRSRPPAGTSVTVLLPSALT
jgi:signal transduction histidine kinase